MKGRKRLTEWRRETRIVKIKRIDKREIKLREEEGGERLRE